MGLKLFIQELKELFIHEIKKLLLTKKRLVLIFRLLTEEKKI